MGPVTGARAWLAQFGSDLGDNLSFFTRLPIPGRSGAAPDFQRIAWAAPLAGAIVGALGGVAALVGEALRLPNNVSATLALGVTIAISGALHEDGLADVADGFGGGRTRDEKLAILRDSRIGAYGAAAIGLSLLIRVGAIAALLRMGGGFAFLALALAGAAARAGAMAPLALLPPARADGAGASASGLTRDALQQAAACAGLLGLAFGIVSIGVGRAWFALALGAGAALGVTALARRQIGGQTGDVAGAAAQAVEAAVLVALIIGGRA